MWAKNVEEAMTLLRENKVTDLSVDHYHGNLSVDGLIVLAEMWQSPELYPSGQITSHAQDPQTRALVERQISGVDKAVREYREAEGTFAWLLASATQDTRDRGEQGWDYLSTSQRLERLREAKKVMAKLGMSEEQRLNVHGETRTLRPHERGQKLSYRLREAGARVETRAVSEWTDVQEPVVEEQFRCICSGQGGSVYSADCPLHDSHVDTRDPLWRKRYDGHLDAQRKIKERLGW